MFMPCQVIILIVMFSGGAVSVRREIVKFSGSLVPIISTCPASCASTSFIAWVPHGLILSLMKLKCITLPFGRMYCPSPLQNSDPRIRFYADIFR
jgi:hypothetical protein